MLNQICECFSKCLGPSDVNDKADKSKDVSSLNLTKNLEKQGVSLDESTVKKIMNSKLINNICEIKNNETKVRGSGITVKEMCKLSETIQNPKLNETVVIQKEPEVVPIEQMPHKLVDCTQVENSFMNHSLKISNVGNDFTYNMGDQTQGDIHGILGLMVVNMNVSRLICESRSAFIAVTNDYMNDMFEYMYFMGDFYRIKKYLVYVDNFDVSEDMKTELSKSEVPESSSEIFFNQELIQLFNSNNEVLDIDFHFMIFSGDVVYHQSPNNVVSYHEIFALIDSKMRLFENNTKIKIDVSAQESMDLFLYSDVSDVQKATYLLSNLKDLPKNLTVIESIVNANGNINGLYIISYGNKYSEYIYVYHDLLVTKIEDVRSLFVDKSLLIKYIMFGRTLFMIICRVDIKEIVNINEFSHIYCLQQRPNLNQMYALTFGIVEEFFSENSQVKGIFALRVISDKNTIEVGNLMFNKIPITNRKHRDYCFILDFRSTN